MDLLYSIIGQGWAMLQAIKTLLDLYYDVMALLK